MDKVQKEVMKLGLADIQKIVESKTMTVEAKVKMIAKIVDSVTDMG